MKFVRFLTIIILLLIGNAYGSGVDEDPREKPTAVESIFQRVEDEQHVASVFTDTFHVYAIIKEKLHAFRDDIPDYTQHVYSHMSVLKLPPFIERKILYLRI